MKSIREMMQAQANPRPVAFKPEGFEGELFLKRMTVAQMFEYLEKNKNLKPNEQSLLVTCTAIVDENGAPVFDPKKKEDADLIGSMPPTILMQIATKFKEVNELGGAKAPDSDS